MVAQLGDASGLFAAVETHHPHVVVLDIRMPPTHTLEGLTAALELRARHPDMAVLVLSQHVETRYAVELDLLPEADDHRRVLAVPAHLRGEATPER